MPAERRNDPTAPQSLLMRHKETEDGIVTFTDELPPFGVLQMADVTWESIGSPDEILVTVTPTSGAVRVA